MNHVPLWVWGITFAFFVALLIFEYYSHVRVAHEPSLKEAGVWTVIYTVGALLFGVGIWFVWGHQHGLDYVTGFVVERALSVDNLFVFIIIMSSFAVPKKYQQEVLLAGVAIAIVLRAIFIALGAELIANFSWIFYIFGAFLIYTGYKLAAEHGEDEEEYPENAFVRFVRRILPVSNDYEGGRLLTFQNGKRMLTPLALVMLAIGSTDVLFAFDSIPAIFAISQEPYIVFTTNAWALMGMIQLYFLLEGLVDRLVYLSYGLAFILGWIGLKLIVHAMRHNEVPFINGGHPIEVIPEIPTLLSLVVILVTIAVAAYFSLRATANQSRTHRSAQKGAEERLHG